jgi:hypothetical protein
MSTPGQFDSAQQALVWVRVSIGVIATVVLFAIYRKGYWEPKEKGRLRDEGLLWMFLANLLWTSTGFLRLFDVGLWTTLRTFISLVNSTCFVLEEFKKDSFKQSNPRFDKIFRTMREHWSRVLLATVGVAAIGAFASAGSAQEYYKAFDVFVSITTILLLTWGFMISFWRREFHILAATSLVVFAALTVSQVADLSSFVAFVKSYTKQPAELVDAALQTAATAMTSMLFIALTFSWLYERHGSVIELVEDLEIKLVDKT